MSNRLERLRNKLAEKEIDGIFITQSENRLYLSGFDGTAGYLLITARHTILATDFRYIEQAKMEAPDFEVWLISGGLDKWFPGLVSEMEISTLGFEGGDVTVNFHQALKDALKKKRCSVKLVPVNGLVEAIRAVKEPEEIEFITKASEITDSAYEYVLPMIKAGMTERQVAWELEKAMRERGSQSLPFDVIVASGPNAALPHSKPTDKAINEGEPVVIDMGAKYRGYASDLSRTLCIGKPNDKYKKVYNTVLDAQKKAMTGITKEITGNKADTVAREVIKKAGYSEAFGHSLGHGVGLAEHEQPRLGPGSKDRLIDGMVFTIEPGIYLPGWGGVRIEDTVLMDRGKVKSITKAKKETYR